ncbi:MAG: hypothetical protein Q9221_008067 [Calogaya cf. arnoldii]
MAQATSDRPPHVRSTGSMNDKTADYSPADEARKSDKQEFDNQAPNNHEHNNQEPDNQTPNDQDFDNLINLMYQNLPQELIDNVEYWLYEIVFCPGYLYPYHPKEQYTECCPVLTKGYDPARPALLCLSKSIKAKYEVRMWSENTWVILAESPIPEPVSLLEGRPANAQKYIRKVHLKFRHLARETQERPRSYHEVPARYLPLNFECEWEWNRVKALYLRRLVLDFTECHLRWREESASVRTAHALMHWPKGNMPEWEVLASAAEFDEMNSIVRRQMLAWHSTA